jgi:putative tricarboxylic transport membrane protein
MSDLKDRLWSAGWRRADLFLAVALILLSTAVIDQANRMPPPFFDPLGSAAVPRFVASILILLALAVLGRCLLTPVDRGGPGPDENSDGRRVTTPLIALGAVLIPVLYVAAMHYQILGFAPASTLFVIALGATLSRGRTATVLWMAPVAVIVGYGLNYLLTGVFYIDLPQTSFFTAGQ